jgi:Bacteriocin-protection, YdeI or OmpD-Associated
VNTMGRLLEEGRVRPAGVAAVEAAKADGRWERAYAGPATITVPDDLASALAANPAAASFFEDMNKTDRYAVLWRVQTASPQSRAKRIEALVQMLAEGKRPGAPAESTADPTAEPKKSADQTSGEGKRPGARAKPAVKPKKSTDQTPAEGKRPRASARPTVKPKKSADQMLTEDKRPGAPVQPVVKPKKSADVKKANTSSVRSHYNLRTPRANSTAPNRPF